MPTFPLVTTGGSALGPFELDEDETDGAVVHREGEPDRRVVGRFLGDVRGARRGAGRLRIDGRRVGRVGEFARPHERVERGHAQPPCAVPLGERVVLSNTRLPALVAFADFGCHGVVVTLVDDAPTLHCGVLH